MLGGAAAAAHMTIRSPALTQARSIRKLRDRRQQDVLRLLPVGPVLAAQSVKYAIAEARTRRRLVGGDGFEPQTLSV